MRKYFSFVEDKIAEIMESEEFKKATLNGLMPPEVKWFTLKDKK